jgi:TolB-like protein/Tfp pilus assembly protein PilF
MEERHHSYEFGPFCLDTRERVLLRDGRPLPLKPKVYETLLALISQSGHLVGKEELMKKVWPDVVVEENNLTGNIFALRRAFKEYDCIETVPRRGYRFTADVKQVRVEDIKITDRSGAETEVLIKETTAMHRQAIDSLAVLPFINASADPEAEYLSDGITESIINNLSQLPALKVSARNTVFRYKGCEADAQEVGRELGVGAVLSGRILQFNARLIIRAELVDAADGWQLWGAQFDRVSSDIIALQGEIAREISDSLQLKLTGRDRRLLAKRHTESTEAYYAYLKGRYQWNKRTDEGLKKGIDYFQQAIDTDPVYALAYTGLADCYAVLGTFGALEPRGAFSKAKAATATALEIDAALAEAHTSSAFVRQLYDWDWPGAEEGYARAVELNPAYATAYFWHATLLAALGRRGESITEIKRALELDPLSLPINTYTGWAYYFAREYDEAVKQYLRTLELDKNFIQAKWRLGLAFAQQGMHEKAIKELQEALTLSNDNTLIMGALGYAYAMAGKSNDAREVLGELESFAGQRYVSAYQRASVHAGLGEKDQALLWLEEAYDEHAGLLIYLAVEPVFDKLRSDSRFADLLRRVGLPAKRTEGNEP